jgi:chain length determinant protein tyrosine kinase EpsG
MNHPILPMPARQRGVNESAIGHVLVELGKLRAEDTERVLRLQNTQGLRFGEAAQRLGLVTDDDVQHALARQFGFRYLRSDEGDYPVELVAAYQPFSRETEMLRTVRSQLMARWFDARRKTLAVIGVDAGQGTSLFCANLAIVFAQLGQQTLLIDTNLRRPRQHRIFGLSGRQGLSDLIVGRAGMEVLARIDTFANLSVLPAGTVPPNPHELLSNAPFTELHDSLAGRFDIGLLDAPAFTAGADGFEVARRAGGALLVARKDKTRLRDLDAINRRLDGAGIQVVGSILADI